VSREDDAIRVSQARDFLLWVVAGGEPGFGGADVLETAPVPLSYAAINARAREDHLCLLCGVAAELVFVMSPPSWGGRAAWLDLCPRCGWAVKSAADSLDR
jgi:hypothetical protein